MEDMMFGQHLRQLRTQASLSLRELASALDVNFTYVSKIELGHVAPPSEELLRKLASVLGPYLDQNPIVLADHLITLAGKVPSDVAEILLRNPGVIPFLRALGSKVWSDDQWRNLAEFSTRSPR